MHYFLGAVLNQYSFLPQGNWELLREKKNSRLELLVNEL